MAEVAVHQFIVSRLAFAVFRAILSAMENAESDSRPQTSSGPLTRARLATGAAMAFERFWPKFMPLMLATLLFASLSWSGLFRALPEGARFLIGSAFVILALAALIPVLRFRLPGAVEITSRIEAANRLQHQPIAVQNDKLAVDADPVSSALWLEHQRRMAARIGSVSADAPRPAIPRLDPFALRSIPVLIAAVALAFSFSGAGGALTDIFQGAPPLERIPPRIDAWVTPPAFTKRAPIFISAAANSDTRTYSVPANSELNLRIVGGAGDENAKLSGIALKPLKTAPETAAVSGGAAAPMQFKTMLASDGELSLFGSGGAIVSWQFKIIPDLAPKIDFASEPERALNGALTLKYKAIDDYGVANAKALVESAANGLKAIPLFEAPEIKLTPPGRKSKDGLAKTSKDLSEHPWAGARVMLTLSATDDSGQEGRSAARPITLPERAFASPLARALIEQRRLLAMDANMKSYVLDLMDALTLRPEDTLNNPSHFLGIHTARLRLAAAANDNALRDVVAYLWEIANAIENSSMSDAQKRLKQAQQKLSDALKNGASDEEIRKLTQELREAMNGMIKELAEQAKKNPKQQPNDPNMRELSQAEIEKMLQKMEDLAKQGDRAAAEELLSQLNEMMENLQVGQNGQQPGGESGAAMNDQMNKLGELMRRQQRLMDETQRMDQGQDGGSDGPQGGGDSETPGSKPGEKGSTFGELQGRQGQLKRDLQGMMDALEGLGLNPGRDFGDAGKSMDRAEGKLGEGDGGEALADESDALDALRKGGQGLMKQMQEAMGRDGGGMRPGQRRNGNGKDPLGRPRATTGPDFGQTTKVPDDVDVQRAREILDAIRKRLSDAVSPQIERNYLERLLKFD